MVGYQKILQLSYVDKFLTDIQKEFRDKYKDDLHHGKISRNFDFRQTFSEILKQTEEESKTQKNVPAVMKTFDQSKKSQKTVASMIIDKKKDEKEKKPAKGKENKVTKSASEPILKSLAPDMTNGDIDEETLRQNREKFMMNRQKKPKGSPSGANSNNSDPPKKKGKESRVWSTSATIKDMSKFDYSQPNEKESEQNGVDIAASMDEQAWVGKMSGSIQDMEVESSSEDEEVEEEIQVQSAAPKKAAAKKNFGVFSMFKNLVGSKALTAEDVAPALEKMKDHLITKNVATDIAEKLCETVSKKLVGKVLGSFSSISSTVKSTLNESCVQILSPQRRVDILRDALEFKQKKRQYTITFCGVNGVGKSTNLAKVCFWLVENGLRVLIAACDTFRAGAIEQLRTHTRKLNALHPPNQHGGQQMIQLYEKGYGKDSAGIAMEAINYARDSHIDVVLVDTAGRMQDNEPLMKSLAKLIRVNQPDLILFVGEALVGNEAVDQLTKFNQALADHSNMTNPRLIDGIILTKFDTIDDKVGAAISMTYTTGQPIVFVGTGQRYTDLKNLNAKAVVHSLMKA